MSTFTEEVIRVTKNKEVMSEEHKTEAEAFFNQGLNKPSEPEAETLAAAAPEGKAPEVAAVQPKPATKIKIGTQEFDSMEDAINYANELDRIALEQDAYNRGKAEAAPKPPAEPERTIEDEIEEELFVDPKKALKKYREEIRKEILGEVKKEKTAEQKRAEQQALVEKTWKDFYSKNTDLSRNQEFVNFVLEKNPELLAMETSKALDELAKRTRAHLNSARESQLPTQELQSKPVLSPQGGAPATATKPQATEKALDFVTQLRNLRKNKAGQSDE